jgi:hypothetical protein
MLSRKTIAATLVVALIAVSASLGETLEGNWNDFLHYTKIGRYDLAKGYAQAVLSSKPDAVQMLTLSESNPAGYALVQRIVESAPDAELAQLTQKILDIIEDGRLIKRADAKIITEEIKKLSGNSREQFAALKFLKNSGEYAIPLMLDAMADNTRKQELPNIIWALPQIGKDAIRPLTTALQTKNDAVKAEIIRALGKIGYPQSLAYLKYVAEKSESAEMKALASQSITEIDTSALQVPAARLFYQLADNYYYHAESLTPSADANTANIWFWDSAGSKLTREKVDKRYFNELMAMRECEWALKADVQFGRAIGLWLASYFKAEATGIPMPAYFGAGHPDAMVYATTAGPEYLHQALARAAKDKDTYVALGVIEALAVSAGEKSLLYRVDEEQPLIKAIVFDDKAVKYSAAIAIAGSGPTENFPDSSLVVENLTQALGETDNLKNRWVAEDYALRAAKAMLKLAQAKNSVIDLSAAKDVLINATKENRADIKILAGEILAYLKDADAQRAIAAMALAEKNDMNVRLAAFESLAVSAKLNANLLGDEMIGAIYSLVGSKDADPKLRSAAACAFGSLNLPSQKVKDLILDQAKS